MTREYPPHVYGGAGVHVDYLSRELAKMIEVDVYCWGEQRVDNGRLHVRGNRPWELLAAGAPEKFQTALEAMSLNLLQVKGLGGVDVVHTHTWYVSMAGFLAKKLYGIPFVLTTHSLEPPATHRKPATPPAPSDSSPSTAAAAAPTTISSTAPT